MGTWFTTKCNSNYYIKWHIKHSVGRERLYWKQELKRIWSEFWHELIFGDRSL